MSLLCSFGFHRPAGIPRWNDGYYFARCRRCGSALVRTAYGKWEVPRGYRVVWQASPPADRPDIRLEPADSDSAGTAPRLDSPPSQQEAPNGPPEGSGPQGVDVAPARTRRPSAFPDFMVDGPDPFPTRRGPIPATESDGGERDERGDGGTAAAFAALPRLLESLRRVRPDPGDEEASGKLHFWRSSRRRPRPDPLEKNVPGEPRSRRSSLPVMIGGAVLALLLVAAAFVALYRGPMAGPLQPDDARAAGPAPDSTPFAFEEPAGNASAEAYVTASLLSCRAAPSLEAERLRNLMRGTRVWILASDGEWVSLAAQGRQCWVLARYLSIAQPL